MRTRFTSSTLLAAAATVGLGIAPALAAGPSNNSGYAFPDFWGNAAAAEGDNHPRPEPGRRCTHRNLSYADQPRHLALPAESQFGFERLTLDAS